MVGKYLMLKFIQEVKISKICKSYDDEVEGLLRKLRSVSKIEEIRSVFINFIDSFTMIPELWILWLRFEHSFGNIETNEETCFERKIRLMGKSHFILDSFVIVGQKMYRIFFPSADNGLFFEQKKLSLSSANDEIINKALAYPHKGIEVLMTNLNITSTNPVKKFVIKSYEKALEFYKKVKDVEIDIEKWFQLLIETNDNDFIINTIEYRLSLEPECAQLWKLYIDYLNEDIKCLDLYSRYCRLFIEDLETVKKYEKEVEKYSEKLMNVSKWWFDIFEFQRQFYSPIYKLTIPNTCIIPNKIYQKLQDENFKQIFEKLKQEKLKKFNLYSIKEDGVKKSREIKELFLLKPIQSQYFTFPSPLILYLLDNSSPEICHKLYETCKYFFYKKNQKPICRYFFVSWFNHPLKPMFKNQASHVAAYSFHRDRNFFKNYIISNYLSVVPINGLYRNIASLILEKVELNLKYLYLSKQDLTFEELKIFNSEKLHTVFCDSVIITNYKEKTFVKIAETFANVFKLALTGYSISTDTMKELALINNVQKIKNCIIFEDIEEYFDPKFIINYLKDNCAPKAIFKFGFSAAFPPNLKDTFMESLKDNNDGYEIVLE